MSVEQEESYRGSILNGYMIHERTRAGYARVLLSVKACIVLPPFAIFAITEAFPGSPALKLALGGFASLLAIAALIGVGLVEARFGTFVWRRLFAPGARFGHWEFEMPQSRAGKTDAPAA